MNDSSPVTLWSALVVRGPIENRILPALDPSAPAVDARFDPTTVLVADLERGHRPDVLISTSASIAALPDGIVAAGSVRPLVTTAIGLGVAAGAEHPAIGTVDEFVETLRAARSVAYSLAGQSGIHFRRVLAQLGIAEQIEARATALPKGFTGEAVIDGRADLAVQQISELLFVPGIAVVGELPAEVQHVTEFSIALTADGAVSEAARALYSALTDADADAAYAAVGLRSAVSL